MAGEGKINDFISCQSNSQNPLMLSILPSPSQNIVPWITQTSSSRRLGFGIQIDEKRHSRRLNAICSWTFVCYNEGFNKAAKEGTAKGQKRPLSEIREGCKARIVITLAKHGKFVFSRWVKEHNNEMVGI